MPYTVEIPEPLEKELDKRFDRHMLERLHRHIEKLKTAPEVYGKPLRRPLAGIWEIYFEKRWRILYVIDYQRMTVKIMAVKHKDEMTK